MMNVIFAVSFYTWAFIKNQIWLGELCADLRQRSLFLQQRIKLAAVHVKTTATTQQTSLDRC